MSRIIEIELAEKKYPLNFSVGAVEKITEEIGDIFQIGEILSNKSAAEMMSTSVNILETLINQGIAYKKLIGEEVNPEVKKEDLKILIGLSDLPRIKKAILEAMTAGIKPTVETEKNSNDPNEMTTQSE